MAASASASSGSNTPLGHAAPAQSAPADSRFSLRPIFGELGQACVWLFNLLQTSNFIYSLKTFCAGMLALYISFCLDLSQPGWSLMTVYIVSQPFSGMVLSRAFARAVGTLVGATMALLLVALFYNVQPLFVVCIAAWIGGCLYFSIYMRELPGAYGAMLSGYTAAIIGFGAISAPEAAFDTATTRCIEILLGIAIATLVSRVALPRTLGRVFRVRAASALTDMQRCIVDTLRGHYDDTRGLADLKKLIADSLALESLRIHASRDTQHVREAENIVRALQGRMLSLCSLLVSFHDRLALFRSERPQEAAKFAPLFARVIERVKTLASSGNTAVNPKSASESASNAASGATSRSPQSPGLTSELLARLPDFEALRRDPELILEYNIILRLIDILAQWQEVNRLGALLASGNIAVAPNQPAPPPEDTRITRYRDHSLAKVAAFGAAIAVIGTCAFWILTGWANGSSAAVFAGVVSCTAAQQDNPAAAALRTLKICAAALVWALIYLFAIMPNLHGFDQFALALAVLYVPLGMLIPSPRYGTMAYAVIVYGSSFMNFHNIMDPNFADIINSSSALMVGILGGVLGFRLLRPVGADWALRRHTIGVMRDLAALSTAPEQRDRAVFETRMLDRINAVMLRLRMDKSDDRERMRGVFTALRMGLNIRFLTGTLDKMPPHLAAAVRNSLNTLGAHFSQLTRRPGSQPEDTPIPALDNAIQAALDAGPDAHGDALTTLVALRAIRSTLTQHAAFYRIRAADAHEADASSPTSLEKRT